MTDSTNNPVINLGDYSRIKESQLNFSHVYSGNPVDRGEIVRRDDKWITDKSKDSTSKFLPLLDLNILV